MTLNKAPWQRIFEIVLVFMVQPSTIKTVHKNVSTGRCAEEIQNTVWICHLNLSCCLWSEWITPRDYKNTLLSAKSSKKIQLILLQYVQILAWHSHLSQLSLPWFWLAVRHSAAPSDLDFKSITEIWSAGFQMEPGFMQSPRWRRSQSRRAFVRNIRQ